MNEHEAQRIAAAANAEVWAPIAGYEETYRVSSLGRVLSLPRPTTPGGLLAWSPDQRGYPRVTLVQGGRQWKVRVHLLVARTFLSDAPDGMEVRHLNGDSSDPRLSNLAYGTHSENLLDRVRHGTCHNTKKTACPRGHAYDAVNTYVNKGRRFCRACRRKGQS